VTRCAAAAAAAAAAAVGQLTQATTLHFTYVQQKGAKSGSSFSQLLQPLAAVVDMQEDLK
jgi:hypothetical protein